MSSNSQENKELFLAAIHDSAWFEFPNRTHLEIRGKDRQKFLHNFCTNEVRNLEPGQCCEAFVTTVQGKILAHIWIFVCKESVWIDALPEYEDLLYTHLDKYLISEDVQFLRRSFDFVDFYVTGPGSSDQLVRLGFSDPGLALGHHREVTFLDCDLSVRRVDWLNTPGYLLQVSRNDAETLRSELQRQGIRFAEKDVFESLRILAGFPEHGKDLTSDNLAQEASRTEMAINFNKGCYLGQEPIARIDAMGHVNQELRGLRMTGTIIPPVGTKVTLPHEVREAGVITSVGWDWAHDQPIGLAMIRRNYLSPGKELSVQSGDTEIPAVVFWGSS